MRGDRAGFASVVFDFDSTLSAIEGIDVLAGARADEIQAMTELAMAGRVPLEEVYGRRLELIRPSRDEVSRLALRYVEALVPDAVETIAALRWLGKQVRVVSGGLLPAIRSAARAIGLEDDEISAVNIEFSEAGEYLDFDRASPLARSGGKEMVIRAWALEAPVLLVGDGATDLEARSAVDAFAAFTGVEYRSAVADAADFVISNRSIAPVLALTTSGAERRRLASTRWAPLLGRDVDQQLTRD
jgi:phosphoserine phosphatase